MHSTQQQQMKMSTEMHRLDIPDSSSDDIQHRIFKVHDKLRRRNEEAYEPECLSIGPYHRDKVNLQVMEKHKRRFLRELLDDRRQEIRLEKCMNTVLTGCEEQARRFYGDEISLSKDDFLEMMRLDGCFIIEFLRRDHNLSLRVPEDYNIFNVPWLLEALRKDLILFENQVPFFILKKLFDMTKFRDEEQQDLIQMAMNGLACLVHNYSRLAPDDAAQVFHLPHLVHERCSSSFSARFRSADGHDDDANAGASLEYIKSTSELEARGVKFEKATENAAWLDISWENGVMKIPRLIVCGTTECVLRNLIAYEQYNPVNNNRKYITDYVVVMYLLIKSPGDVKKLRDCQIIENWLGDDEDVSSMFNKLGKDVINTPRLFCYRDVLKEVNKFSSSRLNFWLANLWRKFFNTPSSFISFLAAVALLILTLLQTVFTIMPRNKN